MAGIFLSEEARMGMRETEREKRRMANMIKTVSSSWSRRALDTVYQWTNHGSTGVAFAIEYGVIKVIVGIAIDGGGCVSEQVFAILRPDLGDMHTELIVAWEAQAPGELLADYGFDSIPPFNPDRSALRACRYLLEEFLKEVALSDKGGFVRRIRRLQRRRSGRFSEGNALTSLGIMRWVRRGHI